jgi:TonB family protein
MKSIRELVGLASTAAAFLSLTAVSPAVTIVLGPNYPQSASPAIVATSGNASCSAPHTDAALRGMPSYEMPTIAEEQGASGVSVVEIDLNANGTLAQYRLAGSSGDRWLDQAALRTARMSQYQPETQNCAPVAGSYLLEVDF